MGWGAIVEKRILLNRPSCWRQSREGTYPRPVRLAGVAVPEGTARMPDAGLGPGFADRDIRVGGGCSEATRRVRCEERGVRRRCEEE